ncbi:hypothetical protein ACN28S_40895 [Cystobacter fuscus]
MTEALARQVAEAGLYAASVSIDGLEPTHDLMRAAPGSFASATAALGFLSAAGVRVAVNTNFNRLNQADLEPLYEHLKGLGPRARQLQITAPLGRAADRPALLLQPWDLLELLPRIAALKQRAFADGITLMPGNNLGYFGPEEGVLRSPGPDASDHWRGCMAGRYVMGIESNGAVKGCPSCRRRTTWAATCASGPCVISGTTRPRSPSRAHAPWRISGASAAPAPSPPRAWRDAASPHTPSSADRATTPTVTTGPEPSRSRACASGSSPRPPPRASPSTMGCSTSSSSPWMRRIPVRQPHACW